MHEHGTDMAKRKRGEVRRSASTAVAEARSIESGKAGDDESKRKGGTNALCATLSLLTHSGKLVLEEDPGSGGVRGKRTDWLAIATVWMRTAEWLTEEETEGFAQQAQSGQCIERSAVAATLAASGSLPIATRRSQSSAFALQHFVTWLAN